MKKSDLVFGALLVPLDYIMLVAAGLAAYAIRFSDIYIKYIKEATVIIEFPDYVKLVAIISLIWLVVFAMAGMYNLRTYRKIWDEFANVVMAASTGILIVVIYIFLNRELFASRFIVLAAWILAILFVSIARLVAREIQRKKLRQGKGAHNVIIIGNNPTADVLKSFIEKNKDYGLRVIHTFPDFLHDKGVLLRDLVTRERIDEIILANSDLSKDERYRLFNTIEDLHLDFKYTADMLGLQKVNTQSFTIGGIPIIEVKKTPLDGWGRIAKRVFDIIGSLFLIILTSPIMLLTVMAIKLESKGPILFYKLDDGKPVQRVGQGNRFFHYYKFRSMYDKVDSLRYTELADKNLRKDSPLVKIADDPRITKVGKFIRRLSIDELPEFFLVFAGKMSLVGPRPHLPEEVAKYEHHHKKVMTIKPGITGMAQISGRSDLIFEEEVKLDTYYIENWTLWMDIKILLQTPRAVLASRKAE